MSNNPETDLDLEKLFLPAWAQESPSVNRYAKFAGGEDRPDRRRDERRGPSRGPGPRGEGPRREFGGGRGGERPGGPRRDDRGPGAPRGDRGGFRREGPGERREPPPPLPLPELNVSLVPDEKGVDSLSRQIKMTGRAYPLFGIAQLILQKPERYTVRLSVAKSAEGQPTQPLFACALDDTVWLAEAEAVAHVLKKHFATFYQAERTATEPPKGKYTFVAQCGMSGVILGPPNYHDYQNQLRKLHAERYARMPFEVYKSRVRIVRDEEVVKKWTDEQSWKTEYVCLNVPEPLKLATMADVEAHFRAVHKDTIIKAVESFTLTGTASRALGSPGLARLLRSVWEDQRRFPLQIATVLSQQFASRGLQFFKVNRTVTHVSVARPSFLDLEMTPVSDGVKRIVDFINANPKCTRRKLMESLAPVPAAAMALAPAPPPAPVAVEGQSAAPQAAPQVTPAPEPTPEQTAVISDLHWLIHQGHVIEFANGALETAKKPVAKPPKPEAKPAVVAPAQAEVAPSEEPSAPEAAGESATAPVAENAAAEEPAPAPAEIAPVSEPEPPASGTHAVAAEPQV
jgi:hypothetical protein